MCEHGIKDLNMGAYVRWLGCVYEVIDIGDAPCMTGAERGMILQLKLIGEDQ